MDKNMKINIERVTKNKGVPLLGEVRLLHREFTVYVFSCFTFSKTIWPRKSWTDVQKCKDYVIQFLSTAKQGGNRFGSTPVCLNVWTLTSARLELLYCHSYTALKLGQRSGSSSRVRVKGQGQFSGVQRSISRAQLCQVPSAKSNNHLTVQHRSLHPWI